VDGSRKQSSPEHIEHHTHIGVPISHQDTQKLSVALVGNPNVGKSLFFNFLSGLYVDVSNYPGTTVEIAQARLNTIKLFDTPGVYGISSFTDEEAVTRDVVLNTDVILNIVDATHLERDLFLTMQLIDMGKKVSVMLNFMDEVRKAGVEIDTKLLASYLGVPVFETAAVTKEGFDQIYPAIEQARRGEQDRTLHASLHEKLKVTGSEAEALLLLEGDEVIAARHGVEPGVQREELYIDRRNRVNLMISTVVAEMSPRWRLSAFIGRLAVNPWTGVPMLLGVLYLIYLFVGSLVAQDLVTYLEAHFGNELWEPWVRSLASTVVDPASPLGTILIGEFGVLTMTVTYLLFLLLPLVIAFYFSLAVLEDSGYLPRLATLVDRSLNAIGLNGSAIIPLILGFGCVTMATITTRLLGSEREKRIATAILQFAIPCSAQLAVIAAMLAGAGFSAMLIFSGTILTVFVMLGTILHRTIPGKSTPLLIDLPPMRMPRVENIIRKTAYRSYFFMKEATPWFFAGALAVGVLQVTGLLKAWQNALAPLTVDWLQLPSEAATAFVMGMVRRDFGAAGLYDLALSTNQTVVALVTITLFVPCIASLMVMLKERGWRESLLVWAGTWIGAFLVGGILSQIIL